MVGRPVDLTMSKKPAAIGSTLLSISNLKVIDGTGRELLHDLSLDVHAGEIVAVAGVQGNGQTELARTILNLEPHVSGKIMVDGVDIVGKSVKESLHSGIAFIPESRELDGLIGSFSIAENLILDTYESPPNAKKLMMNLNVINSDAIKRIKEFDIRSQGANELVSSLSGGNKQKVVLARELSRPVKVVVASQPTRGLDVGSIEFVHEKIVQERDAGRAVLLFSSELDEVFALADRIAVMYRGTIIDIVPASISRSDLGLLMAGIKPKVSS
jgi:simple sugar transport system ATP-binding protein